jgi:membrane-bound serine protease (ClpP class)
MKKGLLVLLLVPPGFFGGLSPLFAADEAPAPLIYRIEFEETVNRVSAEFLNQSIERADREGAELVLIVLDTPGGYVNSMELIVKQILNARTPVVVWVGPKGAMATSAGFFMLISADVAAMAPGTTTGAASPISLLMSTSKDDVGQQKAENMLASKVRTIAEKRNRGVWACEGAVTEAKSYTEEQALEEKIINLVAGDEEELLEKLDGMKVQRFDGSTTVVHTRGARSQTLEPTFIQKLLAILADPNLVFLIMAVGVIALWVEFSHPGLILPGVVGALCILAFAYSTSILDTNMVGLLLIVLAIVLFILEIKVTSYGMLTLGGIGCLIFGSLMLFQGPIPELRLSLPVVLPTAIVLAGACTVAVHLVFRAHREKVSTGKEGLRGKIGNVVDELHPEGKVFVHGELWDAVSTSGTIGKGIRVRIVGMEEMKLRVEPEEAQETEGG